MYYIAYLVLIGISLVLSFNAYPDDTVYTRFQIGPWWDTCTSNSCGIEFGSYEDAGVQGEFEVGKEWNYGKFSLQAGPAINVGGIPLHGRNTDKSKSTADGDYLITNSALLNGRLGYHILQFMPYVELGGGMSTFVSTFGGWDYAPIGKVGAGIEYSLTEQTSVFVGGRYQRSMAFDIGPYKSDGLDGFSTQLGFTYRF